MYTLYKTVQWHTCSESSYALIFNLETRKGLQRGITEWSFKEHPEKASSHSGKLDGASLVQLDFLNNINFGGGGILDFSQIFKTPIISYLEIFTRISSFKAS